MSHSKPIHRVHMVEEDLEAGSALALLLAAAGYEVETTFDESARLSVEASGSEVRLIDLDHPKQSARELAAQLRRKLDSQVFMPADDRWEDEIDFPESRSNIPAA